MSIDGSELESRGAGTDVASEGAVVEAGGDDGTDGQGYEIDGERYTQDQVKEALEALKNRDAWEADYKRRDQAFAGVRKAVEGAFDKTFNKLDVNDLNDLKAFGIFNQRLRSDPEFAKAWEAALVQAYKGQGLTTTQAKAAAKEDVAEGKTAGAGTAPAAERPAAMPKELLELLAKVPQLEQVIVGQRLAELERHVDSTVDKTITAQAKELPEWSGFIRRHVLYGLAGYNDADLMEKAQSGELNREVAQLVREATKAIKDYETRVATGKADKLKAGKAGAPPAPIKGGTAEGAKPSVDAVPGKGLTGMHSRLRELLSATRGEQ